MNVTDPMSLPYGSAETFHLILVNSKLTQNLFCLYSCSKVGLKGLLKKKIIFLLLLVCGDIEKIPGPDNWYSLKHPKMCGFFRAVVLFIFEEQKLLPKDENDLKSYVDTSQGFIDMQNVFQGHFDIHVVELAKLRKNISRFQKLNKDWSRDHCEAKNEYYNTFSPTNWNSLSESEKSKHSLFCDECPKNYCQLVTKFPSSSNKYLCANKEIPIHVAKTIKKKMKKMERHSLKVTMNEVSKEMNSAFESTFGISFDDSFQVHNKLEKQSKVSRRQLKTKHYREVVDKIKGENEITMVDRLYGSGISLRKWDRERKIKYYETVPQAEKRSFSEKNNVQIGIKNTKDHVGPF